MSTLREFWFPFLLAIVGVFPLFFAGSATGNGRRLMLTFTVIFMSLAVLSYIWGDPVRGPFANVVHPHDAKNFLFTVGAISCGFPVSQLKDGIDFSRCAAIPGQPISIWVKNTWWSGLYVKLMINGPDGKPVLIFDNKALQYGSGDFDVNYDDYAFEMVTSTREPQFQFVIAKDYGRVYLNTRLFADKEALILKAGLSASIPIGEANQPQYKLDRIFKYPSYLHQGDRE
jgi:hypothetical protein